MRKKILAAILVFATLMSVVPAYAQEDITVYLSVSKYAELVKSKNGDEMAYVPVDLTGKDSYTLDDAFAKAHEMYYETGADGYASSESDWGFGVDMLWGDNSYNFGYQVNGGSESVMGPDHIIKDGDCIDAIIYKNSYPDTESYAAFDKHMTDAKSDEIFEITLSYVSGYDDNWNSVFSPCQGATIIIDGEETEYITDENGKACIEFESAGNKIISAKKEKTIGENIVPAITAPVCVVNVKGNSAVTMIHNLAEKYADMSFEDAAGNLPWIIADLMVYEEAYGVDLLSNVRKKEALSLITEGAEKFTKPGDMAKAIIAVRALGYDAKSIITSSFDKVNLVKNLTDLIDNGDASVTNIYTLPYVLIALSQGNGYVNEEQLQYIISSAIESKDSWQSLADGTDAMTPMILALSPYYNSNAEVKTAIDEAVELVKSQQREDGLIDGFEGYEPASTALAICAFSSLGIESLEIENGGKNLIDGLMSTANAELNKFPNAFADEQGLRGLLAWQLLADNKKIYDFYDYPLNDANVSGIANCPVVFDVIPANAAVTVTGHKEFEKNVFDLEAGSYEYTAAASGYNKTTGTITVTEAEASDKIKKVISISLASAYSGGGGGASVSKDDEPLKPEEDNKEEEKPKEDTEPEFNENTFEDVKESDWYYSAVKYAYENNLFSGTDKGFEPDIAMTRAMLVTVLHRLSASAEIITENPFKDVDNNKWYSDSIKWAAANSIISGVTDTEFAPDADITREQLATIIYRYAEKYGYDTAFSNSIDISKFKDCDMISDYALDAVSFVVNAGIMTGRDAENFCPKDKATRAEVASMLMRFAGEKAE